MVPLDGVPLDGVPLGGAHQHEVVVEEDGSFEGGPNGGRLAAKIGVGDGMGG